MDRKGFLKKEIEIMRECMEKLIENKKNLHDEEVVKASKELDEVLNEYNKLLVMCSILCK